MLTEVALRALGKSGSWFESLKARSLAAYPSPSSWVWVSHILPPGIIALLAAFSASAVSLLLGTL